MFAALPGMPEQVPGAAELAAGTSGWSPSASTLRRVWEWMRCYDGAGYGFSYHQAGPQQWRLQVTRRHAA